MLLRPEEARAQALEAGPYLKENWSAEAIAPLWEAALGLPAKPREPGRVVTEPLRPVAHAWSWFGLQGRNRRPWLLAGDTASPEQVEAARVQDFLVMSLGTGFRTVPVDLALVVDVETLQAHGEALLANAGFVLVPADLHHRGWAAGRSLASWGADLPALARLRDEGRLVRFDLWTGSEHGVDGDFAAEEVPLRLLAKAGVRTVRTLGLVRPEPTAAGFEALTSIRERVTGGACTRSTPPETSRNSARLNGDWNSILLRVRCTVS